MRFDVQDRIMSFSYERDRREHIETWRATMRRWLASSRFASGEGRYTWLWFIGYVLGFGVLMELYRRYFLTYFADISTIPTFAIAMLQVLPVFILIYMLLMMHGRWNDKLQRKAFEARMAVKVPVQLDIYPQGICTMIGKTMFQLEWTSLTDVFISKQRIDFDSDIWSFYIPSRVFEGPEDYARRAREIRGLWKKAVEAGAAAPVEAIGS